MSTQSSLDSSRARESFPRWRRSSFSNALLVIGAVLLIPAALLMWADATVFDSDGFGDAASESLGDEAVQERLAVGLTDRIVANNPDLALARPLIKGAAAGIVESDQFRAIFDAAVRTLHERVFDEDRNELVLDLTAALTRIIDIIRVAAPQLAERIPPNLESGLVTVSESDFRTRLIRLGDRVSFLAFVLPVLSLAAFAGSIYTARDRRAATFRLGVALAIVAALVVVALRMGGWFVADSVRNPDNTQAAGALWWAWVDSLRYAMWAVAAVGVGMAGSVWWTVNKGWRGQPPMQRAG